MRRLGSVLLLLVSLLLVSSLVFTGCGDDEPKAKASDAKAAATKDDDSDDEAEEAEDEAAEEAKEAVSAGIDYEDAVLPHVRQLQVLVTRYDTTADKLVAGTIDAARAREAFTKQAAAAVATAKAVRAIDVDDDYLDENSESLAASFDAYAAAMRSLATIDKSQSQATLDATFAKATKQIGDMDTAFTAWATALDEDPEERTFLRTVTEIERVGQEIGKLGL